MFARLSPHILAVSEIISRRANELCHRINADITDEDDFTSRLAGSIEQAVNDVRLGSIQWTVQTRKLDWRGRGSEESRFGADLGVAIRMSGDGFDVIKGYLVQAKLVRDMSLALGTRSPFIKNDRVYDQCKRMLGITPESYVWFYSPAGVSVLRAGTMMGVEPRLVHRVARRSLYEFFVGGFLSWSGDQRLGDISKSSIDGMAEQYRIKQVMEIHAADVRSAMD